MKKNTNKNLSFAVDKLFLLVLGISLLLTTFLIYNYIQYRQNIVETTRDRVLIEAQKAAITFSVAFEKQIAIANEIAAELSSGELLKEDIVERITKNINLNTDAYGMGVAYIPYINDPNIRTESPYYVSRPMSAIKLEREKIRKIYATPIFQFDSISNTKIKTGEVFFDYLESDIKDVMASLKLGKSGYGFILSRNGQYIAHPIDEYNENQRTIFETADEEEDKPMKIMAEHAVNGESGIIEHFDKITGQQSWVFYEPITSINWALVVVFIQEDLPINPQFLRYKLIFISLSLLTFLVSLFALVLRITKMTFPRLILFTVITSVLLIIEIGYVWNLAINYELSEDANSSKIVDRTGVNHYLNQYSKRVNRLCKQNPFYIPTGIFIETIEFPTANTVFLSGTVWQKYTYGLHDSIKRGILFPEAINDIYTESYHQKMDKYEVYGWYFRINIRKNFTYVKYPFDRKSLSLRILPRDFKNYIVLQPELDAYKYTNPQLLPGISKQLTVPGWTLLFSNFVYKMNEFNSDFGMQNFNCREKTPELYFDISLSRNFLGTIFSGSMPVVVMLAILFILQTITTRGMDTVARILGPTGSFFFAALLAHVGLRQTLQVKDIVFFEYFYILLYMMILYVFLNSVLFSRPKGGRLVLYKNNLIFKLIYWPFFFTVLLIISIFVLLI